MNNYIGTGFILGLISVIFILISGPGTRFGLIPFTAGLLIIFLGFLAGLASFIISIVKLISGTGFYFILPGLALGILTTGLFVSVIISASNAPAIHDITTDTKDPPQFVSILPLRKYALNPPEYGGGDTAGKQAAAFPDIKTIYSGIPPAEAFDRVLESVKSLKLKIADFNKEEGRIEATDTTFWFGFKDDVVIRILPHDKGSKIDIRSESRVGGGDMGTNAKRVRKLIKLINSSL